MFESIGVKTHIDIAVLYEAVDYLEKGLGWALPGRMKRIVSQGRN